MNLKYENSHGIIIGNTKLFPDFNMLLYMYTFSWHILPSVFCYIFSVRIILN